MDAKDGFVVEVTSHGGMDSPTLGAWARESATMDKGNVGKCLCWSLVKVLGFGGSAAVVQISL